ncbi:MAG: peptidylprolyl isomerase [Ruminococcus flavefaciens]|nr:peptidylprolyl isomerase [Ruminococcus flavefaciens]MCM1228591.1 peptidylprolyl isomerase [Ruminococcus flavefaciens]
MKINGLLKLVVVLTVIMGLLTVFLLFTSVKQAENNVYVDIDPETMELVQLEPPKDGDTIAIVDTTLGEFRFVLYPEYSPNAVKNFTELAESGYYNNTYVFSSESGAYSAMGSKQKNGEMPEGYDKSRELVERELNQNLWTFRGAVCVMNTTVDRSFKEKVFGGGTYFNGSRFAVINTIEMDDETKQELLDSSENKELNQAFADNGGIPNFAQQMTVIGQTYEGFDVIEALANLETLDSGIYNIPKEDVMINSVEIAEYTSENGK